MVCRWLWDQVHARMKEHLMFKCPTSGPKPFILMKSRLMRGVVTFQKLLRQRWKVTDLLINDYFQIC